jgi:hypothetical protein
MTVTAVSVKDHDHDGSFGAPTGTQSLFELLHCITLFTVGFVWVYNLLTNIPNNNNKNNNNNNNNNIEHSFRFTEFRTSVKASKFYYKTQHLK